MITNLKEINRVLLGVNELTTQEGALIENVIEFCSEIVLEGNMPNHQDTIDFCMQIGLLKRKYDRIQISDLGDQFLFFNKTNNYSLNTKQKNLLALNCFLKGRLSKEVKKILEQFKSDHRKMTFVWSKEDGYNLKANSNFLNLLYQAEVLFKSSDMIMVNPEYAYIVSSFQASKKMTQEELEERLAENNEVGKIAEEIAVNYEKKRLLKANCQVESDRVLNISPIDVGAGYDIMSFNDKSIDYDRYIEVKGSRNKQISFIMSKNEIEVAKKHGSNYWLYFIGGINIDDKTSMEPKLIQNPILNILENQTEFDHDCLRVLVKQKQ